MKITKQRLKQIISEELENLGEGWFGADTSDLQPGYESPEARRKRMQDEYDTKQAEAERLRKAYENPETFQGRPERSSLAPAEPGWKEGEGEIVDPSEHPETMEFDFEGEPADVVLGDPKTRRSKSKRAAAGPQLAGLGGAGGGAPEGSRDFLRRQLALQTGQDPSEMGTEVRPRSRSEARVAARAAGELTYTYKGRKYGTRGADETRAQWKRKMARNRARKDPRAVARAADPWAGSGLDDFLQDKPSRPAMFREDQQKNSTKITKTYLEQIIREELGKLI